MSEASVSDIVKACRAGGAVDPQTCAFVVQHLMRGMGDDVPLDAVVASLKKRKPFLFVSTPLTPAERGLMSERDAVLAICATLFLREFDFNDEDKVDDVGTLLEDAGVVAYVNGEWVRP